MVLTLIRRTVAAGALALIISQSLEAQSTPRVQPSVRVNGIVDGNTIVETARRYLGVRYVLGGTTPRAFDCSGFIRYVFALHGLGLPRTAHEQAAIGVAPDERKLEPGDLLFFYGGHGAQHIAMYIGGDSIIHASSSGHRVMLARLSGAGTHRNWFGQRLIAVRRVLPAAGTFDLPASLAIPDPFGSSSADDMAFAPSAPLIF
ncbi:MAG: C40 family peptidase [Gemmatimonadaceae bacterium]|nr:C40 family peptidase [Gemmatimonadaceae bacterium]